MTGTLDWDIQPPNLQHTLDGKPAPRPPMLWGVDSPRTRATDPVTSHEAADSNRVAASTRAVLTALAEGPADDSQILTRHIARVGRHGVAFTPQRLRTARAELVEAGRVVHTGGFHVTGTGRRARVWGLTPCRTCGGVGSVQYDAGEDRLPVWERCTDCRGGAA